MSPFCYHLKCVLICSNSRDQYLISTVSQRLGIHSIYAPLTQYDTHTLMWESPYEIIDFLSELLLCSAWGFLHSQHELNKSNQQETPSVGQTHSH